jgi:hypothetical protein
MGPNCLSSPLISRVIRPECPCCLTFNSSDFKPGALSFQERNRPSTGPRTKAQRVLFSSHPSPLHLHTRPDPYRNPCQSTPFEQSGQCCFALGLEFPCSSEAPTGYRESLAAIYRIDSKLQDPRARCPTVHGAERMAGETSSDSSAMCTRRRSMGSCPTNTTKRERWRASEARPRGARVTARLRLSCLTGAAQHLEVPGPSGRNAFLGATTSSSRWGAAPARLERATVGRVTRPVG